MGKKSTKVDVASVPTSISKKDPKAQAEAQENSVQKIAAKSNKRMRRVA